VALAYRWMDMDVLAKLAATVPSQLDFWTFVRANTTDLDVIATVDQMLAIHAGDVGPNRTADRLADAVQELQAVEQTITVATVRTEASGAQLEETLIQQVGAI